MNSLKPGQAACNFALGRLYNNHHAPALPSRDIRARIYKIIHMLIKIFIFIIVYYGFFIKCVQLAHHCGSYFHYNYLEYLSPWIRNRSNGIRFDNFFMYVSF